MQYNTKSTFFIRSFCFWLLPIVLALATTYGSKAADSGRVSLGLAGIAQVQNPEINRDSVSGLTAFGFGFTSELRFGSEMGLEADLLYLNHRFKQNSAEFFGSNVSTTFSSGFLQVPVLIRFRPIPLLNLGLGAYYSRVLTNWSVSAPGFSNTSTDFGKNDFGLVLAAGAIVPIAGGISVAPELRYARSF